MDRDDEKLTVENVDEQIEHYLSESQTSLPYNAKTTFRAVRDLQSIYAENRRLEQVWARINNHVSALNADNNATSEELSTIQPAQEEKKALPASGRVFSHPVLHRTSKRSQQPFRWNWRTLGLGLAAAMILLAFFAWPIASYALYGTPIGILQPFIHKGTPQNRYTVDVPGMKEYSSQYFTIQYPSNWVITRVIAGGSYLQTVQFRPSATSAIFVNINVLPNNGSSADQLLHMDPDVKLGTQLRTSSITYHDIPWTVGSVDLTGPSHTQADKLKVAYTHQGTPYRIEFGATADKFDAYTPVFNTMFASFYAHTTAVARSAAKPTIVPMATPTGMATPSSTAMPSPTNIADIKVYSNRYFTIQYPSNWVITNVTTGSSYQQTVQFRPSTTSAVFVNVNVMYHNNLSSDLLLLTDPDVKLGTQLRTSSVTYHGIPWKVGIVNLLDLVPGQPSEVEVACSNQNAPYKIELSAPPDMFNSYTQSFNTMLASFYPAS
ncbi:hypothetical protein ccbrp13_47180 [Ktedonobacteria bacterium brp13]|nr:hypothetical protein ccbrp13_47180 [Ktedonobacteria bacterium brp13]